MYQMNCLRGEDSYTPTFLLKKLRLREVEQPVPLGHVALSGRGRLQFRVSPTLPFLLYAVCFIFLVPRTVSGSQYVLDQYLVIAVEQG